MDLPENTNFKNKDLLNYFLSDFCCSRQSLAIIINFDTSILSEDCPIPKSLNACSLANFKASSVRVILFCVLSEAFHFSIKFSSNSVMMTFSAFAMLKNFLLVIYNICPKSILTIRQHLYTPKTKGLIVKKTNFNILSSCREGFFLKPSFSHPKGGKTKMGKRGNLMSYIKITKNEILCVCNSKTNLDTHHGSTENAPESFFFKNNNFQKKSYTIFKKNAMIYNYFYSYLNVFIFILNLAKNWLPSGAKYAMIAYKLVAIWCHLVPNNCTWRVNID